MLYTSPEIDISQEFQDRFHTLKFIFKGKFTTQASQASCKVWSDTFDQLDSSHSLVLIWDCMQMDGFDFEARNHWLECMKKYSERIEHVYVVSSNMMIRGSAHLMLKFFHFNYSVVKSLNELPQMA